MRPSYLLHPLVPVLALGLTGCARASEVSSGEWSIVDGERTNNNEPAVVLVTNRRGGLCTGTLIASRVVLTAKHCVQRSGADAPDSAELFIIGVGDSRRSLSATYDAVSIWTTPGPYQEDSRLTGLPGVDVALVTLGRETDVEPIPVYRGHPRDYVGLPVRAVGFGQIRDGSSGVKYRITTQINAIDGNILSTPPATCPGDSGGPLITEDNQVVGVTSFGSGVCGGSSFNSYNRVDLFLEEIDRVLSSTTCANDSDCPSAFHCRDDANVCIRGSRGNTGDGCAEDGDCAAGLFCAMWGDASWCSPFCETTSDCPANFACTSLGERHICSPNLGTTGTVCMFPANCLSGACEPLGPEDSLVCSRMCSSDAPCETGFVCRPSETAADGWCVRPSVATLSDTPLPVESNGGCTTTPHGHSSVAVLLMIVLGGLRARRRWRS